MSNLQFNTIAGGTLGAVLAVLGLNELSHAVFHPHYPEEPAYRIEIASAAPTGGQAAAEEDGPVDFGRLFADEAQLTALIAQGEKAHRVCVSCHTFEAGGGNLQGPALYGVFGRQAGALPGYNYSDAMEAYGQPWLYQNMYDYLEAPGRYVQGTTMSFAGVRRSEDRVALVAYLRSLDDSPEPLPAPLPEAAPAADAAQPTEAGPAEAAAPGVVPNAPGVIEGERGAGGGPLTPSAPSAPG